MGFIKMIELKDYIVEGFFDNKLLKPLRDFIQKNFKKRVGFKEIITVCIQGDKYEFTATIDTGNGGVVPTLGVDKMEIDGDKVTITIGDKKYTFDKKGEASPTVGNVIHHRPIIIIDYIKIGGRKLNEPFIAVTNERKKSTKTLINRDTMTRLNLVVDPSKNNITEKLHISKNVSSFKPDMDEWYINFHKIDVQGKTLVFIEDALKISSINEEEHKIKVIPEKTEKEFEFHYIVYNKHIILAEDEYDTNKALLIPRKEAILMLKDIKDKKENTIDTEIFGDSGRKELRIDSYTHSVTEEEIKNVIIKLLSIQ